MATPQKTPNPRTLSPEVPVVSYPTPNVGDLLVVQDVDTRLPGYSAANYGDPHPDTVTYPGLKLVLQTPLDNEANFMWVRRVYANERFNQEAYNYALKYSGEDPTKPIYVRTYTLPRETYAPVAKGTPDPVHSSAVLVEEAVDRIKDDQSDGQLDSLFLKVVRVYETLPGPGLTTKKKGSANSIPAKFQAARQVTVTKTVVDASTIPDDTTDTIVESSVEQATVAKAQQTTSVLDTNIVTLVGEKVTPQQQVATVSETMVPTGSGQDAVVADALTLEAGVEVLGNGQSIVTKVQAPSVFSEQSYSAEKTTLGIPSKFKLADPPVKQSHVEEGIVSPSDVELGKNEMDKSSEQVTEFKKKVSSSSMSAQDLSLEGTQTGMWGVETVTEKLLHSPTAATGNYLTKEDSVDPTGDGRYVQKTTNYPASPITLREVHTDETYKIRVHMDKRLVDSSTPVPESAHAGGVVERHAVDAWNSIEIDSYVTSLPSPETWHHTMNYSFPEELLEVGVYYTQTTGGNASAGGVNNNALSSTDSWRAEASANATAVVRAVPYVKTKAGYSGPCRAVTTRSFFNSPPSTDITPTLIAPVSGAIIITGVGGTAQASSSLSGSGNKWLYSGSGQGGTKDVVAVRHAFGPVLHSNPSLTVKGSTPSASSTYTASGGSTPSGSIPSTAATASATLSASLELPPSSHAPFLSGDSIIAVGRVEKWRFGVWIQEVTTIYHP